MNDFGNTTKQQVLEALEGTEYLTEVGNNSITVWFHEGNGWNFKVSFNFKSKMTKIMRYNTNGHVNTNDSEVKHKGLHITTDWQGAEYLFSFHR